MKKRYSIITNDLTKCIECGRTNVNLHEVWFGSANRKLSIEDGLVIPLCQYYHHNQFNCTGIHFDNKLNRKWKRIAQITWMEYYNKTEEDFRERYGRSEI